MNNFPLFPGTSSACYLTGKVKSEVVDTEKNDHRIILFKKKKNTVLLHFIDVVYRNNKFKHWSEKNLLYFRRRLFSSGPIKINDTLRKCECEDFAPKI